MKLSEHELRSLNRLEKRERQWLPVTRWVCLGLGVLTGVLGYFAAHELRALDLPNAGWLWLFPIYFFFKAGIIFGITFYHWRGDIKLRLLLRLIREHEDPAT
jgi:hypothetical protein